MIYAMDILLITRPGTGSILFDELTGERWLSCLSASKTLKQWPAMGTQPPQNDEDELSSLKIALFHDISIFAQRATQPVQTDTRCD